MHQYLKIETLAQHEGSLKDGSLVLFTDLHFLYILLLVLSEACNLVSVEYKVCSGNTYLWSNTSSIISYCAQG